MARKNRGILSSLLSVQKPRISFFRKMYRNRFWIMGGLALIGMVLLYFGTIWAQNALVDLFRPVRGYEISFSPNVKGSSTDSTMVLVRSIVKKHVSRADRQELLLAARKVQNATEAKSVEIVRLGWNQLWVDYVTRTPVALIEVDRWRFLDEDGQIYGQAGSEDLPKLMDFSAGLGPFSWTDSKSLILNQNQRKELIAGLELLKKLRGFTFKAESIRAVPYRGFELKLRQIDTEIIIGSKNVGQQLQQLAAILEKLQTKGKVAKRIELDYSGKAFVQEG